LPHFRITSCCENQMLTSIFFGLSFYFPELFRFKNRLYTLRSQHINLQFLSCFQKTIDNRLRGICNGKHTIVFFCFEFYVMLFEPSNRIFWRKYRKRTSEFFFASRVEFHQLSNIKTMVSDITSSTSRNANLRKYFFPSFENGNL